MLIRTRNNEELGIYIEKLFCLTNKIKFNTKRKRFLKINYRNNFLLKKEIDNINKIFKIKIKKHIGNNNKNDFILTNNKSLSLKTCKTSNLICPQLIGQTTLKSLSKYFKQSFKINNDFKKFIFNNLNYVK